VVICKAYGTQTAGLIKLTLLSKKYDLIVKGTLSSNLRLCVLSVMDICKVCLTKHYAMKTYEGVDV
jgi:hypothetical protein